MTQSKQYNLRIFCELKNIQSETEEAQAFLKKKFYEQLTIIKELRDLEVIDTEVIEEENEVSFSIIDRIRSNV
jgi:hypothetical protein